MEYISIHKEKKCHKTGNIALFSPKVIKNAKKEAKKIRIGNGRKKKENPKG